MANACKNTEDTKSKTQGFSLFRPPARSMAVLAEMKRSYLHYCNSTATQRARSTPKRGLQDFTIAQLLKFNGVPRGQVVRVFSDVIESPVSHCQNATCAEVFTLVRKDIHQFLDETFKYAQSAPQLTDPDDKKVVLGSLSVEEAETPYTEPYRPQVHFSPKAHWMNDPNGMFYYQGTYHLFYQYYPFGDKWGPMHWGHAVSKDLVSWQEKPVAIKPDSLGQIYSGSAVVDVANTSGLKSGKHPPIVAIYSQNAEGDIQHQSIAYSNAVGARWTKYPQNPVIANPGLPAFRDPKVFWHEPTKRWVMVLAASDRMMIYRSADLKSWEYMSSFGENQGAHGGVWECPDLVQFKVAGTGETKWVMFASINPGGYAGGSGTQYFVGSFDGKSFKADDSKAPTRWLDFGADNYAGVTFFETPANPEKKIFLGWMSNWQYADKVPTQGWRGAMTVPRDISLVKSQGRYELVQPPVKALNSLRDTSAQKVWSARTIKPNTNLFAGVKSRTFELVAEIDVKKSTAQTFGFKVRVGGDQYTSVYYDRKRHQVVVDRTKSGATGFAPEFASVHRAPALPVDGKIRLRILVDWSSVEVFVNDGRAVITDLIFPDYDAASIETFASGGQVTLDHMEFYPLKSMEH